MSTENDIEWRVMTPGDAEFWPMAGPLLLGSEMRREIGSAPHVDPSDMWVMGMVGWNVIAIACLRVARRGGVLCHAYVAPDYRRRGYHSHLIEMCVTEARRIGLIAVHAVASPSAQAGYHRFGFEQIGTRGRFTLMRLVLRDGLVPVDEDKDAVAN